MKRYFIEISYNGELYHGWQVQPNAMSVQEEIETVLTRLNSNSKVDVVGCGRTDAGVHAHHYIFHIDLDLKLTFSDFLFKANKMLSDNISFHNICEVEEDKHARFSAKKRTYRYFIHNKKNPFKHKLSWYNSKSFNLAKMNESASLLIGTKDFTSFSKVNTDVKTNICSVYEAKWVKVNENEFYFEISADRFLRNMVRAIVGTLLEVGIENIEPDHIETILKLKDRGEAALSVPAHGLFLWEIIY